MEYKKIDPITYDEIISCININPKKLDEIKAHTFKKIEYVKEYAKNALFVFSNVSKDVYFLDCMSNAGVYRNKDAFCSCIEVLNTMAGFAINHPSTRFHLWCNDKDTYRFNVLSNIFNLFRQKHRIDNLDLDCKNLDVIEYFGFLSKNLSYHNGFDRSIILYVDPYNLASAKLIDALYNFAQSVYCDIIFNYFSSDLVRNCDNLDTPNKMKMIENFISYFVPEENKDEQEINAEKFLNLIMNKFVSVTRINFKYAIQMRTSKNTPLYYLIYLSPSITGLSKCKEAAWKTFDFHSYYSAGINEYQGPDLFGKTVKDYAFEENLSKIKKYLLNSGIDSFTYNWILKYSLENTIFPESQFLREVIKPLIKEGFLTKQNRVSKANYKDDNYLLRR